jgi:aminoglycoside phosphotransferase (APT) family kinase protein
MAVDLGLLATQLQRWAAAHHDPGVTITDLRAMPGHAGLSFGFSVTRDGAEVEQLVVRMPPAGVRRRGNTDVLRQVPLLRALRRAGVAVPEVFWFDDDEQWFGVPYFMVGLLPGETYQVREPAPMFSGFDAADVLGVAIDSLAAIHLVDHRIDLATWEAPKDLATEIEFWTPILAKAAEPAWVALGERTRDLLLRHVPVDPTVGVFHGDFQTNNVLFTVDDGAPAVSAVLDWEISGIGAQLLDLGWLLFMNDAASWVDAAGLERVPAFEPLVDRYAAATGRHVTLDDVAFYRALSGYRFGVISGLNVMLHRTGKRHDPEWERISMSVPAMFERACELVG